MSYHRAPIPLMAGREKELMSYFLKQSKKWEGLTSAFEKTAGMNGKWVNPEKPYELNATKMMRMMMVKALFQEEDEYIEDALAFRRFALDYCEAHSITLDHKPKPRTKSSKAMKK